MSANNTEKHAQIVYLSHGGGPLPILGDPSHAAMISFMQGLPSKLHRPDAILVISAHWEETAATLQGAAAPSMFYDYYGFPKEAYDITYPAPGNPGLAKRIIDILNGKGVPSAVNDQRGFDHGLFIPLKMMYPSADIPALQISLLRNLDPRAHIELGKALGNLMTENILVVGSGFSFHNLRAFNFGATHVADPRNDAFQDWLIEVCANTNAEMKREEELVSWEHAPSARYCHPREEHLLPLHVCMGMAAASAKVVFNDYIGGKRAVAFLWQ
jgi:aromatic ring-opening dioxygenase catalytic subunit (LigB family)